MSSRFEEWDESFLDVEDYRVERALNRAALEAIYNARRCATEYVIWEDGAVRSLKADETGSYEKMLLDNIERLNSKIGDIQGQSRESFRTNEEKAQYSQPVQRSSASRITPLSYLLCRWFFRVAFRLYFRLRVYDPEHVPVDGPVILASNHASFLDPALVGAGLRRPVNYLAREKSLSRFPFVGSLLRSWQTVPVDRDKGGSAGLKVILDRLLAGGAIILFPEGTRTANGQLQFARSGIGLAVIKSTAPVIPVRVFGSFDAYSRWMRFPRPRRIAVKYGHPMWFKQLRAEAENCSQRRRKEIYQQVANEITEAIAKLEPHEDDAEST